MNTKYIFVTGGVVSGLGKGVLAASVGYLLKERGFKVFSMKLDPYLNANPGILSPIEHGECFVTDDGTETDLDLGYYERFMDTNLTCDSSFTSGKLFRKLLEKENNGDFKGQTIQMVPHFTNEIQDVILNIEKKYQADIAIIEIGGTVGDLESNPYFYGIAQLKYLYPQNVFFIHTGFVPYLESSQEFKSKPTQHSIATLRSLGISPNIVFLRSHMPISEDISAKIAKFSFLDKSNIINVPDFDVIYEIPLYLDTKNVADIICRHLNIKARSKVNLAKWKEFVNSLKNKNKKEITIAMCGKYVSFLDSYKSIIQSIIFASVAKNVNVDFKWIDTTKINEDELKNILLNVHGLVLLPGSGLEGWENEILAAKIARDSNLPTLGICLGFSAMAVEQARRIKPNANSIEFRDLDEDAFFVTTKIFGFDENKYHVRIGSRKINILPNTKAKKIYNKEQIEERHKHRYFVSYDIALAISDENAHFSSFNESKEIAETFELKNHPFYFGVQYHPEYKTRPLNVGKLFPTFLEAALQNKKR
ncbi:CTP synthase [Metamycoplasma arthritidis]|nr:CTP synthase [Metamycoplasma arthritidis]